MPAFKKLSLGRLPRVLLHTLALDSRDLDVIAEEVTKRFKEVLLTHRRGRGWDVVDEHGVVKASGLADVFGYMIDLPKVERERLVPQLNKLFDDLLSEDFFGTEGQCDPRGDHRD